MPKAEPAARSGPPGSSVLARGCAAVVTIFAFLPIANWIPGGHEAPWYSTVLSEWLSGSAIAVGVAFVAYVLLRRVGGPPRDGTSRFATATSEHPWTTALIASAFAFTLYLVTARVVLSGKPLLIDEIVQVMQARFFAAGDLSRPVSAFPEFFSALHVVDVGERVFSQFPPGGPLMLVPGVLLGAPYLTGPFFGAVAVVAFWFLVRSMEARPALALGSTALLAAAPFMVFMAGSHMNHVPTLAWVCVAMLCLRVVTRSDTARPWISFVCGSSFGVAASIRPVDAAAFALPAAVWLLWRSYRHRRTWRDVVAAGIGVALPAGAVLLFNSATTGHPTLFGYELLWGKSHALGFHQAPWGGSHTPARGLELVNLYFLRLQTYLLETPLPSLVPPILALFLAPALTAFDAYLIWSAALLVAGYFAYWHDGFFLGPRFFYLLLPVLSIWTARLPGLARTRFPRWRDAGRFVLLTYGVSAVVALTMSLPTRIRQYQGGLSSMRHDYVAPATAAGVRNAVILVRESWGAQLIARLWGLAVPRSDAEAIYRSVDTCILEQTVSRLEGTRTRGAAAVEVLRRLLGDSTRLEESRLSPDRTERVLPGVAYTPTCARRMAEDRAGYSFLAPVLAADPASNVYARDLHARDTLLLGAYPGRSVFVLRAVSSDVGAALTLEPLSLDSARAEWRSTAAGSR